MRRLWEHAADPRWRVREAVAMAVAVAADPATSLPRYRALDDSGDPDVAWIVRESCKKSRLARLL